MSRPSPVTRPRGPLPPQVYWFRRGLVLGLALLLVGGLVLLLASFVGGGGSGAAVTSAATSSPTPTAASTTGTPTASPSASPSATASSTAGSSGKKRKAQALSASQGTCRTKDVVVTGAPGKVAGGSKVTIPLLLTTSGDPCTFAVSADSVVAKITSGDDRIWSSQDCRGSIPTTSVVVRPKDEKAARVNLTWSGQRSAEGCPGGLAWARPGSYHLLAAALGGQQTDQQFALRAPSRPVVTKTAKPTRQATPTATPKG